MQKHFIFIAAISIFIINNASAQTSAMEQAARERNERNDRHEREDREKKPNSEHTYNNTGSSASAGSGDNYTPPPAEDPNAISKYVKGTLDEGWHRFTDVWNYIDAQGNLSPQSYGRIDTTIRNRIIVEKGSGYGSDNGVIDARGKTIIPAIYNSIISPDNGKLFFAFEVSKTSQEMATDYSLFDSTGKEITKQEYRTIELSTDQLLIATKPDGSFCLLDHTGNEHIAGKYKMIQRVNAAGYIVSDQNDKWGVINNAGNAFFAPRYAAVSKGSDSFFIVQNNEQSAVINTRGNEIIPFDNYSLIKPGIKNALIVRNNESFFGITDENGKVIVAPAFIQMRTDKNSPFYIAEVLKKNSYDHLYGLMDDAGNWVIKPTFNSYEDLYYYAAKKKHISLSYEL